MGETHNIVGPAQGTPQSAGQTGACIRLPLDAAPSPRWSKAFAAHLATDLVGHASVGHLRLDTVVQGAEIVLEGVEPAEAEALGRVVRTAIDETNQAAPDDDGPKPPFSMPPAEAEGVARAVSDTAYRA
jgi:hypothetical protein